jgi:ABC-type antimicrobial peptide transport system permease subunit
LLAGMRGHMQGTGAGDAAHPLWALVDPVFAATFHVGVGERFTLASNQGTGTISYVVGGMITRFPTMYDGQFAGFLVADMDDYFAALANPVLANTPANGPTEYWLRTTGSAAGQAALAKALGNASLQANDTLARTELEAAFLADPLAAGMTGLLLIGAVTAAVLAVVGGIVQSALSARHRLREFAILRTLGTSTGQLLRMLLGEQLIVYVFGLIGGTLLGVVLSTATLPFLQFSDALTNPDQAGVPPYALVFNPSGTAIFYAVLVGAFVVALLLAAQMAARVGLGKTLRLGED